jgi:hypothetical protein
MVVENQAAVAEMSGLLYRLNKSMKASVDKERTLSSNKNSFLLFELNEAQAELKKTQDELSDCLKNKTLEAYFSKLRHIPTE